MVLTCADLPKANQSNLQRTCKVATGKQGDTRTFFSSQTTPEKWQGLKNKNTCTRSLKKCLPPECEMKFLLAIIV